MGIIYSATNMVNGEIYNSLKEAAYKSNISNSSLSNCCRGKTKSTKGTHWSYKELI